MTRPIDPALRDLEWLLSSPPLLSAETCALVEKESTSQLLTEFRDKVLTGETNASSLAEEILRTPRHYKLGIYCEALLGHCIKTSRIFPCITSHLPVFLNQRSVGEFDFLVRTPQGRAEHWELAVKFYCLDDRIEKGMKASAADFLGPEGRDSLGMKLEKLLNRQIVLSKTAAGANALQAWGLNAQDLKARVFSRGCFFYPWTLVRNKTESAKQLIVADFLHAESAEGIWVRSSELAGALPQILRGRSAKFAVRERLGWITAPMDSSSRYVRNWAKSSAELLTLFQNGMDAENSEGVLIDILCDDDSRERLFVLNPRWPTPKT